MCEMSFSNRHFSTPEYPLSLAFILIFPEQIGPYCSDSFMTNEIEMHKLPPFESKEDNLISDSMNFHGAVPYKKGKR